jgi:FkbM family methyltransferase
MNSNAPFWVQTHYRRELLNNAVTRIKHGITLSSLRYGLSILKRYITGRVAPGNLEKYEAIWKSLSSMAPGTILDIGSLDGADAVELGRMFPAATIHSFEPDPANFPLLQQTAKCCDRIIPYQIALSDNVGKAKFFASGAEDDAYYNRASGSILRPLRSATDWWPQLKFEREVEVSTTTVDEWATTKSIRSIDLVWMDVQGAELQVLQGMGTLIESTHCIVLEVWMKPAYDGAATLPQIQEFLESHGFYMTRLWLNTNKIDGDALFQRV